jgi:Bacteriophage head to tail connecting protein
MAEPAESQVAQQKRRADRCWTLNGNWDKLYRDAYDYAIPMRRPGGAGKSKTVADRLFDMTAPTSAMHLAGTLQRILFSQPPALVPGALVKQALAMEGADGTKKLQRLERELEKTGNFIYPFMEAGDLSTATHEMCIDLGVGTGFIIPMRGTPSQPIIFYTPPADEVAISGDAYGRTTLASWKRMVERAALLESFPKGNFSAEFKESCKGSTAYHEITLYQDFWQLPDGRWQFAAYMDRDCNEWIASEITRTKPFACPRYYRVAGEMRGRGPILLAMPSIKTVNKAQELALKSAAIQMLGIWGYRASAGFNPDTASQSPGAFWAMQSTGGIMGPDVSRLDPANGRLDVASMVIEGMQQQIRDGLMDNRLAPATGTPRSASEIAAQLQQNANIHLGGFMRLWREVHPDIVPRCAEILNSFSYLRGLMDFNELIVGVGIRSPMAAAIAAEQIGNIAKYAELVTAFVGPQKLPEHLIIDDTLDDIAEGLQVPKSRVPDGEQRLGIRQALQQQMQQQQLAEAAVKAAPQVAAGGMRLIEGGAQAA